jgi:anti-sigma factor RsiW
VIEVKCEKVEKLLSNYLDNSLKEAHRNEVKEHLAKCRKCRENLNIMSKIDNLVKLKVKEKPSKEYWEDYWPRLEGRLDRTMTPQLSGNRRWTNLFIPRFSSAFSGILIALLILVNALLYMNIRQLTSLQSILNERQERMQKELSVYLTKFDKGL